VAEITVTTEAKVIEIGEDGEGRPSVTLEFDGNEVLLVLKNIGECRRFASSLFRTVPVAVTLTLPEEEPRG